MVKLRMVYDCCTHIIFDNIDAELMKPRRILKSYHVAKTGQLMGPWIRFKRTALIWIVG